jgi:hypothetical protein
MWLVAKLILNSKFDVVNVCRIGNVIKREDVHESWTPFYWRVGGRGAAVVGV